MSTKQTRTRGEDYQAPVPVPKAQRTQGRPSDYDAAYLDEACRLIRLGMTDEEIAEELGVSRMALWRWREKYPEFRYAIKEAKDAQDARVVSSLMRTAHEGNVTAQIFWLKNRQPDLWRDRKETEIIVPDTGAGDTQIDARGAALAALALFSEAQYDPAATGILLEATANAEETDDGATEITGNWKAGEAGRVAADDDWERGDDLDPGEL